VVTGSGVTRSKSPLTASGIFNRKAVHCAARFIVFEEANMLMWP